MMNSLIHKVTENKNNYSINLLKSYEKYQK